MTSVYLAARFDQRARLTQEVAIPLINAGHIVTSTWMEYEDGASPLGAEELAARPELGTEHGMVCREDVHRAEALAVFTEHPSTTGGYHVEFGMAAALGKQLHIVGPVSNIFHTMPGIILHQDIAGFLKAWGCA